MEEALKNIRDKPLVDIWPDVGVALGLSRYSAYEGAKQGAFEVMEIGRRKKAITASLRRKLGLEG